MMKPIELLLIISLAVLSGCGESADLKPRPKSVKQSVDSVDSLNQAKSETPTGFLAGLTPNQRPTNAPVIREFTSSANWRKQALAGITEPVPEGLDFLDSQGAWYTPFNRPGMPGYYDLRNLHRTRNANPTNQ